MRQPVFQRPAISDYSDYITWSELATDGTGWNVMVREYDIDPTLSVRLNRASFRVHNKSAGNQLQPTIIGDLVGWVAVDGSDVGFFSQRIGGDDGPYYPEDYRVNTGRCWNSRPTCHCDTTNGYRYRSPRDSRLVFRRTGWFRARHLRPASGIRPVRSEHSFGRRLSSFELLP